MNGRRKSDRPVVATKPANKTGAPVAERVERRGLAKGKPPWQNTNRALDREDVQSALGRIRQAAVKDKKAKFTSLMHHIYNLSTLREAYYGLKRDAAPGVDGETWRQYGENLKVICKNSLRGCGAGPIEQRQCSEATSLKTTGGKGHSG
jgi:phosphoglucomutase